MNCRDVQPWLNLPKEDLPARSGQEIRDHIETCPVCRKESEELEALTLKLRSLPAADPGESFWRRFPEQIREELAKTQKEAEKVGRHRAVRGRKFSRARLLPLAAAAGVAALTLAAVFLFNRVELPQRVFIPDEEDLAALEEDLDFPVATDDLPTLMTWVGANAGTVGYYYGLQELEPEDLDHFEQQLQEYATSS